MSIILSIIKSSGEVSVTESSKTFPEQGGSLGRGPSNTWVLDDPERFLSSCHCQISLEGGQYYLTDLSTNGTFFNGSQHPMGKGVKLALNDGHAFSLGDYEFLVGIGAGANFGTQSANPDSFLSMPPVGSQVLDDPFSSLSSPNDFGQNSLDPFSSGHVSNKDSLYNLSSVEMDPLAALDKVQGGGVSTLGGFPEDSLFKTDSFPSSSFEGEARIDQSNSLNEHVSWPNTVREQSGGGGIPDDWDDDFMARAPLTPSPPLAQPRAPLAETNIPPKVGEASAPILNAEQSESQQKDYENIQSELRVLKQLIGSQKQGKTNNTNVDTSLIDAMFLQNQNLVDEQIIQVNKLVGEVVREMFGGLMQVLGSRSSIKNEFRMNVTTIQPVENNPLKFSANVDDALENMFIKDGNAYKKPVEAVKDSFESIGEHQIAVLAGIRFAFKGIIERFDPVLLGERFAKHQKSSLIPSNQKAKNWDGYLEYYNELVDDMDNSFQYLFGDEFVRAYEEQLQKLAIARKSNKIKK